MNTTPLVSVIVPVYNAAACLDMALASAQAQTYPNLEILVVDDGSTDDSRHIIAHWANTEPRVRPFQHAVNAGLPTTRNTALEHARGELVAFLDADDVWLPDKTARQIELLQQDARTNLAFTNYWTWDGQKDLDLRYSKRKHFPEGDQSQALCYHCLYAISSVMVRRDTLDRVGTFDPTLFGVADWDLWLRIAEEGLWARGIWEPQLRYRVWSGNMSNNSVRMREEEVRTLDKALARSNTRLRQRTYRHALQIARGQLEFARVRPVMDANPAAVPAAALRAWRHCPTRMKWLLWFAATAWPAVLGGRPLAAMVHRKIRRKW